MHTQSGKFKEQKLELLRLLLIMGTYGIPTVKKVIEPRDEREYNRAHRVELLFFVVFSHVSMNNLFDGVKWMHSIHKRLCI